MVSEHVAAHPRDVCAPYELSARRSEVLLQTGQISLVRDQPGQGHPEVVVPGAQAAPKAVAKEVMSRGINVGFAGTSISMLEKTPECLFTEQAVGLDCA